MILFLQIITALISFSGSHNRTLKNDQQVYMFEHIFRGDGYGRGAGRPCPSPQILWICIVKRTKAEKDSLLVVAPKIFGPSAVSDDY